MLDVDGKFYEFTLHAYERMLQRGIAEKWVVETLRNGVPLPQSVNGRLKYTYDIDLGDEFISITVIVQDDYLIITVYS